jgi:hypothetical protein
VDEDVRLDQEIGNIKRKMKSNKRQPNHNCTLCWGRGYFRRFKDNVRSMEACGCIRKVKEVHATKTDV